MYYENENNKLLFFKNSSKSPIFYIANFTPYRVIVVAIIIAITDKIDKAVVKVVWFICNCLSCTE
jgi:hypothetical protein